MTLRQLHRRYLRSHRAATAAERRAARLRAEANRQLRTLTATVSPRAAKELAR